MSIDVPELFRYYPLKGRGQPALERPAVRSHWLIRMLAQVNTKQAILKRMCQCASCVQSKVKDSTQPHHLFPLPALVGALMYTVYASACQLRWLANVDSY